MDNIVYANPAYIIRLLEAEHPSVTVDAATEITKGLRDFIVQQDLQGQIDREIRRLYSQRPAHDTAPASANDDTAKATVYPDHTILCTDGSCLGNPGKGGWGFVVTDTAGHVLERRSGARRSTTNNQMELQAIAEGLELVAGQCARITIRSDSRYACDAFNKHWLENWHRNGWLTYSKQPVKNQDLWQRIELAIAQHDGPVEFRWVKGHAGHPGNELADQLANQAARRS